eukprot:scaffold110533_cov39-Prasinocladus_malaysianus.AAC.1
MSLSSQSSGSSSSSCSGIPSSDECSFDVYVFPERVNNLPQQFLGDNNVSGDDDRPQLGIMLDGTLLGTCAEIRPDRRTAKWSTPVVMSKRSPVATDSEQPRGQSEQTTLRLRIVTLPVATGSDNRVSSVRPVATTSTSTAASSGTDLSSSESLTSSTVEGASAMAVDFKGTEQQTGNALQLAARQLVGLQPALLNACSMPDAGCMTPAFSNR